MRDLVYYVAVSLDGFIADPEGGFDAFLAEGDHMTVLFDEYADALPAHVLDAVGITPPGTQFDTVIMGWNTLAPALAAGIASPYPHLHQVVASRSERAHDPAITTTSDPLFAVRKLKRAEGKSIWLCGGGEVAGSLLPEIDRLILKRNPITFGSGISLFGDAPYEPRAFTLSRTRTFDSGVTIEEYTAADRSHR